MHGKTGNGERYAYHGGLEAPLREKRKAMLASTLREGRGARRRATV